MKLNKALFCLAIICITTTLADYRHFPARSNMFSEEKHSRSMPFLRRLASTNLNSHNESQNKNEPVTVRLQGGTDLGYYYVTLFFGSPAQKQTLIVDTGSVTTTIPCTECGNDCGKNHFDRPFNHKNSESFEEFKCNESFGEYSCYDCSNQCPFSVSYVEGSSYSGHFNKDLVVFGNEIEDNFSILNQISSNDSSAQNEDQIRKSVEEIIESRKVFMPFGCTNRETKLFYEQEADGILGLGVNTNTRGSPPNLLDALNLHDSGFSRAFSLCLAQDGGYFTMGGFNAAYHAPEEKTHYVSYSDAFGQYKVYLHKIEMDGEDVGLKPAELNHGEGAFLDSGTTMTHVPSATYNGIRNKLHSHCQAGGKNCGKNAESGSFCWKYNRNVFPTMTSFYETFPTFKFFFGKERHAEYEWRAEDYLYEKDEDVYCLGLAHYERESILGGTFMKNHDILFDKDNKKIGFVRANCNGVQEVTKPLYIEKEQSGPGTIIKAGDSSAPSAEVILNATETESGKRIQTIIIASLVAALVCTIIGGIACLYVRFKKQRASYQTMGNRRNIRIEIPSAGFSEQLDISGTETPQASTEQAQQEERGVARHDVNGEDDSMEIRIEDGEI